MNSVVARLLARVRGERRHTPRLDVEAMHLTRRQLAVVQRLSRLTGRSPEELVPDYRLADHILAGRRR